MKSNKLQNMCHLASRTAVFCFLLHGITLGDETKWIAIGDLHNWYSSAGNEREVGRRGLIPDQQDGLRYPAQFNWQDCQAAKAMWIGSTNFYDANRNSTYDYKVVHVGPRVLDDISEIMPQEFKMYGKYEHPNVYVGGLPGSEMMYGMDEMDELDESLPAERMIYNVVNTALGVTVTRRVYAFTNQYHQNYHIFEYEFENTGIIAPDGTTYQQTLTDMVVYFQYRYAPAREAGSYGRYVLPQSVTWGHSVINDMIFNHPDTQEPFRAQFTWLGEHSEAGFSIIGGPDNLHDGHLMAPQYVGIITLHADKSADEPVDDISQPFTTMYLQSDHRITSGNSQFNIDKMTQEYGYMVSGHPERRHGEDVGCPTPIDCGVDADTYVKAGDSGNPGGYSSGQGFGPYTLDPGESVRLVIAEGAAGINRDMAYEIGRNWKQDNSPFTLPPQAGRTFEGGGTTNLKDVYKNTWVYTGEDSIIQTFKRAKANYESGYAIPEPPRPPSLFEVNSGGDRVSLSWSYAGGALPANVAGFEVYRAVEQPDTTYDLVFACGPGTDNPEVVTSYDDKAAVRGFDYYYYVVAFDDGSTNDIQPGVPLSSSKFWTMTSEPASLRRPPGNKLDAIRIVPNPYNIKAQRLQLKVGDPNQLNFYNIPPLCDIMIYTERGDLVKTLHHTDGSGDESWNSVTSTKQVIVSGVYIAYIKVTEDYTDPITSELLFRKGESTIKKFIIIR
jgi:hypothetical protein